MKQKTVQARKNRRDLQEQDLKKIATQLLLAQIQQQKAKKTILTHVPKILKEYEEGSQSEIGSQDIFVSGNEGLNMNGQIPKFEENPTSLFSSQLRGGSSSTNHKKEEEEREEEEDEWEDGINTSLVRNREKLEDEDEYLELDDLGREDQIEVIFIQRLRFRIYFNLSIFLLL